MQVRSALRYVCTVRVCPQMHTSYKNLPCKFLTPANGVEDPLRLPLPSSDPGCLSPIWLPSCLTEDSLVPTAPLGGQHRELAEFSHLNFPLPLFSSDFTIHRQANCTSAHLFHMYFVYFIIFIYLLERQREIFSTCWFTHQMPTDRPQPGSSQEPGTVSGSSYWVPGLQILEPSPATSLTGSWN